MSPMFTRRLVNRVVPLAKLGDEVSAMALAVAEADPFQLRMMKLTCNQAQDAAGLSGHARSTLSHWTGCE